MAISRALFLNQTLPRGWKNVDCWAPSQYNRSRTSAGCGQESQLSTSSLKTIFMHFSIGKPLRRSRTQEKHPYLFIFLTILYTDYFMSKWLSSASLIDPQFMTYRNHKIINNYCCFKPLSLGMICWTLIQNTSVFFSSTSTSHPSPLLIDPIC